MLKKMHSILQNEIKMPPLSKRLAQQKFIRHFDITMVIDGTEQKIVASTDRRKVTITFSGKKQVHTCTKLIGVGLSGKVWYVSPSYPGHLNDLNLYQFSEKEIFQKYLSH